VIIVAGSCIYGIDRRELPRLLIRLEKGVEFRRTPARMLVDIQYQRNDVDFHRGTFRSAATSSRSSRL